MSKDVCCAKCDGIVFPAHKDTLRTCDCHEESTTGAPIEAEGFGCTVEMREVIDNSKILPISKQIPMGTVTFDCPFNGKVVVTVTTDGKVMEMVTDMTLLPGAMTPDGKGNVRVEQSPVFELFTVMMEAQKAKG